MVFVVYPDKSELIGRRYVDRTGQVWELVGQNDLHVPYWSKVVRGGVQKKQYTLADGERMAEILFKQVKEDLP